jgi:hypothetical protein
MRRIQSSAQLLERQRNPGLGYWSASNTAAAAAGNSSSSHASTPGRVTSPLMMTGGGQSSPAISFRESVDGLRSEAGTPTNGSAATSAPAIAPSPMSKPQQEEEEVNLEVRIAFLSWLTDQVENDRTNLARGLIYIVPEKCDSPILGTQGDEGTLT